MFLRGRPKVRVRLGVTMTVKTIKKNNNNETKLPTKGKELN